MFIRRIIASATSCGLALGAISGEAIAQIEAVSGAEPAQATQFRHVEQPLWAKGVVTIGGITLIGWELWWFLLSKPNQHV